MLPQAGYSPPMRIARAGMDAVPQVHALIREAAQWLVAKGEPLWGEEETSGEELLRVARAGELVIGTVEGQLSACMYLHIEDRIFWPKAREGEALYLHRLAVARRYAGLGYALAMLGWAGEEAKRMRRSYLRLDCEPRPKLLALYQGAGFIAADRSPIRVGRHFVVRQQKFLGR